jgi:transcriptional regulator with XRE-family HTH domain
MATILSMPTATIPLLTTLQDRLRYLRAIGTVEPNELDHLAGLRGRGHVGAIEKGTSLHPRADTLAKLADALGASLDWLVRGMGRPPTRAAVRAAIQMARRGRQMREEAKSTTPPEAA